MDAMELLGKEMPWSTPYPSPTLPALGPQPLAYQGSATPGAWMRDIFTTQGGAGLAGGTGTRSQ